MISSIEFNGFTWDQNLATIKKLTGIGLSAVRIESQVKSQQHGAIGTGHRLGYRTIGFSGFLKSASGTPADYLAERDSMMGALMPTNVAGDTMTFNLITGDVRTVKYVRIEDTNFDFPEDEPSYNWNQYALIFRADFPYFEGDETDGSQQITASGFGVVVPAPLSAPLSSTSGAGSAADPMTVTNAGNADAWPVFTITGPGAGFTVSNSTTGDSFYIGYTLAAGETIVIDTWDHTVTFGSESIRSSWSGDWIFLQPGANTLTFTADSGTSSDTQLRTVFKDTYLGI